ncbi:MAG: response regulator [Polyangiaceae bacterium]|nr:response regulator [Polyangiaceae bacterium]
MAGEPILVVDDNPANVRLVQFLLTKRGYDVRVAMDASAALEVLGNFTPKLVLMDLQLPGMDGLELTRKIKAEARFADLPIIAVTAFAMKGDEQRAREAGCDGYVTKPIDTRTLPKLIADYLAGDRPKAPEAP